MARCRRPTPSLYTGPFTLTTSAERPGHRRQSGRGQQRRGLRLVRQHSAVGNGTGLTGQYWTNTTGVAFTNVAFNTLPTLTRTDAMVNFNWSTNAARPLDRPHQLHRALDGFSAAAIQRDLHLHHRVRRRGAPLCERPVADR